MQAHRTWSLLKSSLGQEPKSSAQCRLSGMLWKHLGHSSAWGCKYRMAAWQRCSPSSFAQDDSIVHGMLSKILTARAGCV